MSELDLSRVVAVVPARGGSVRLPSKNMKVLAGAPLVGWAITHAECAGIDVERIAVSSDDEATLVYATSRGAWPILRPEDIAQGVTPPIWNVRHALKELREKHPNLAVEHVVYLQPTSPFRRAEDITSALAVAQRTGCDAVVTVRQMRESPYEIGFAGRLRPMPEERRSMVVVPNGAVYVITAAHLDAGHDWWDGITMAHVMPEERSLDIDVREDFDAAQRLAGTMLGAGVL